MTSRDYTEYSKYYMYLKTVIDEAEVYLQNHETQALAQKLYDGIKVIVMKQYLQL